jgi:hypothetical protein
VKLVWRNATTLCPGVTVSVPRENEPGRLQATSGTTSASSSDGEYEDRAIIPSGPWRELSKHERRTLLKVNTACEEHAMIKVVTLASEILGCFLEIREFASYGRLDDVRRRVSRPAFCDAISACSRHARDCFGMNISVAPGCVAGGIRVNAANLPTVTIHPDSEQFVGMHVDNWTRLPLDQRHLAPQRICINLGSHPRYFLFVNISIRQVLTAAEQASAADLDLPGCRAMIRKNQLSSLNRSACGTLVGRAFLASSPRYPVIRLKLNPGEAYIAPTENLIHDGSSLGALGHDISLSLREGT